MENRKCQSFSDDQLKNWEVSWEVSSYLPALERREHGEMLANTAVVASHASYCKTHFLPHYTQIAVKHQNCRITHFLLQNIKIAANDKKSRCGCTGDVMQVTRLWRKEERIMLIGCRLAVPGPPKNSINSSHPYERLSVVHANELKLSQEFYKFVSCLKDGK